MGTCFLHGNGGGGIKLPFRVIGGTTQPSNPKDGTIWVKTSQPITRFEFSNPWSTASVGEVCVTGTIGGANPTGTNKVVLVLQNNVGGILYREKVTITGCKQVQGSTGNWVDLCAYVYYNGSWTQFSDEIDWSKWIIKDGSSVYDVVGVGKPEDSTYSAQTVTKTDEDGRIKIACSGSGTGMVYAGPVDLTGKSSLTIEGTFSFSSYADWYNLCAWTKIGTYTLSNRVAYTKMTTTGATLDVSKLSGTHYVGFTTRGSATQYITNLYMNE